MAVVNTRLLNNPILQRMPKNQRDWIQYQNELAKQVLRIAKLGDGTLTTSGGTTISGLDEMPGEVDTAQIATGAVSTAKITDDSITDTQVTHEPADGDITYTSGTQPRVESAGVNGEVTYTSPSGVTTKATVSWSGQAQISNTTSGTATGYASIAITIKVNSVTTFTKELKLEAMTGADDWGMFAGTYTVSVPAGQDVDAFLTVGRTFSTGGSSPAQTITWRDCWLNLLPMKK